VPQELVRAEAPPIGTGWRAWPLTTSLPYVGYRDRCWSNGMMEIHRKNWTPCVPPFKITDSDRSWLGSFGYLWLPINVPQ